jgi:hypothetical protein
MTAFAGLVPSVVEGLTVAVPAVASTQHDHEKAEVEPIEVFAHLLFSFDGVVWQDWRTIDPFVTTNSPVWPSARIGRWFPC